MTRRTLILLACLLSPIIGLAVWWGMPGRSQAAPVAVQPPVVADTEAPADWVAVPVVPAPISIVLVPVAGGPSDSRHDAPEDDDYADLDLPPVPPDEVGEPDDGGIGIIHAYPDELSQQYAGANGAHRMKEALKIIGNYLAVDGNRDGRLTFDAADRVTVDHPWRWWINDDNDQKDADIDNGADVPGERRPIYQGKVIVDYKPNNGSDAAVNGRRDLVDFFPVGIDLNGLRQAFPPSDGYVIQLRQADGAVNVVPMNLAVNGAFNYLTQEQSSGYGSGFGQAAHNANVTAVASAGVAMPSEIDLLWRSGNASAVMMIEARNATRKPLEMVVVRGDVSMVVGRIDLSISPVEDMYRWLNLRDVVRPGGKPTRITEPENRPDSECSDAQVVWVHGFNVGPEPARAWMAELFKRMYQARMKSGFTGVTWAGDLGNGLIEYLCADYHLSVVNGAKTAPALAQAIAALPGPNRKILVSHSMGAGVIGPAITDYGLSGYDKYFAIDAAMPMEAYDAGMPESANMIHPEWRDGTGGRYPTELVASQWNELWPSDDERRKLTWRGRLGLLPRLYNVYSTGEEVLANSTGQSPNILPTWLGGSGASAWSWQAQEWLKGGNALAGLPLITFVHSAHGGWGFNIKQMVSLNKDYDDPSIVRPNQRRQIWINEANWATPVTGADLFNRWGSEYFTPIGDRVAERLNDLATDVAHKSRPLFKPFDVQAQLAGLGGARVAYTERIRLLAEAIPAVTYAMGANPLRRPDEDEPMVPGYDMNEAVEIAWPSADQYANHQQWFHSDIKDVAYLYTWRTFDYIVSTGALR